jgi:hypothetical protein
VLEVGCRRARDLRRVVVAAEPDGRGCEFRGVEVGDLVRVERPSLEPEAQPGGRRERGQVVGLDGAQVALGRDVQADRLDQP